MELQNHLLARRSTIKTGCRVAVDDPNYGEAWVSVGVIMTTYGTDQVFVAFNAEGIVGTFLHDGPVNGEKIFPVLQQKVKEAYLNDCADV